MATGAQGVPVRSISQLEENNHKSGRGQDAGTKKLMGPVKSVSKNPTKDGGIFRATKNNSR